MTNSLHNKNRILDRFAYLAKNDEVAFGKQKLSGQLAFSLNKYKQNLEGIIRTRMVIILAAAFMLMMTLSPLFADLPYDHKVLTERLILLGLLIFAATIFNRWRMLSIALAILPCMALVVFFFGNGVVNAGAGAMAIMILIGFGFYHQMRLRHYQKLINEEL